MAESKPKTSTPKRSGGRAKASSASTTRSRTTAKRGSATRSGSNGSKRANRSTAKSGGSRTRSRATTPASSNGRSGNGGIADTIKHAATKAKGPAVAVGAAAAGVAGGLVLKSRTRSKTVLGVPVPKHLPSVDPKAVAKTVGNASRQFAKTSKTVSKDIERAGDQAERIGKILS